jgi:hypothetical protein
MIFVEQVRELVRESIKDRADVLTVFEHLCKELEPAAIAKEMGIAVEDVYDKIRLLRRRSEENKTNILGWQQPAKSNRKERRTTRRK